MHMIGWTPTKRLVHTFTRVRSGRTGRDLKCGTFYAGIEKERFLSYPGHDPLRPDMKKNRTSQVLFLIIKV